jgi:hypothetical protein
MKECEHFYIFDIYPAIFNLLTKVETCTDFLKSLQMETDEVVVNVEMTEDGVSLLYETPKQKLTLQILEIRRCTKTSTSSFQQAKNEDSS